MNKNTVSALLKDLREEDAITEAVRRPKDGALGRPTIVYALRPTARKELSKMIRPLQELERIEGMLSEFSSLFLEYASSSKKSVNGLLKEYYETIIFGVLAIFEAQLLIEKIDPVTDNFLALEHFEAIRRILWEGEFTRKIVRETRRELERDKEYNFKMIRTRLEALRKISAKR